MLIHIQTTIPLRSCGKPSIDPDATPALPPLSARSECTSNRNPHVRRTGSRVEVWTKSASKGIEALATDLAKITGGREIEYRDHKGNMTYKHGGRGRVRVRVRIT